MLRKRTAPIAHVPLTPALHFVLMTGEYPSCRLAGWVALQQLIDAAGGNITAALRDAWTEHAGVLTAEAAIGGFVPWGATQRLPSGSGVRQWRAAFLTKHSEGSTP